MGIVTKALSAVSCLAFVRGGSWNNNGRNCRSAYRNYNHAGNRNHNIGFRLALAPAGMELPARPALSAVAQAQTPRQVVTLVAAANASLLVTFRSFL